MKKVLALIVALLFVFAVSTVAFAAEKADVPKAEKADKKADKKDKKDEKKDEKKEDKKDAAPKKKKAIEGC